MSRGAGGTAGGIGNFFIGLMMMCAGGYMLLQSIIVSSNFSLALQLFNFSPLGYRVPVTGGMIFVPFIFGIGMIFYNAKNFFGWLLVLGSIAALVFGVISSLSISMRTMTAFELITLLILTFGGLGLFLSSLRDAG